ncbi:MAG: response regulator transcription factor [Lachnospiraceae bacterium]|nr:response regulator transcription factor [Lachnospiraceae bacterium]
MRILLAEDTKDLNKNVTLLLKTQDYDVDSAFDGEEALEYLKKDSYDCIILDIMMPKKDGITVLKELRERHIVTPVILLTAKAEVNDRVEGLDSGADDYLSKPFASKELLARVRALIRRQSLTTQEDISIGNVSLAPDTQSINSKSSVRLSNKEFELISIIMANSDIELSTEHLLEHVWKTEPDANEDTVWLYISYLKRKLEMVGANITITGEKGQSFKLIIGDN